MEINKELIAAPDKIDIENTQHICIYLRSLRQRLRQTVQQHSDLIQASVNLVKEMTDVSTLLGLTQSEPEQPPTKIKRLIMEFENMSAAENDLTSFEAVELRDLLADFRRLHESQLLLDSLMCYKRAKESFEQVDSLLNRAALGSADSSQASPNDSQLIVSSNSRSLREKIQAFNEASVDGQDMLQNFTTCFCKLSTLNIPAVEEVKASSSSSCGDVDVDEESEIDQITEEQDSKPE